LGPKSTILYLSIPTVANLGSCSICTYVDPGFYAQSTPLIGLQSDLNTTYVDANLFIIVVILILAIVLTSLILIFVKTRQKQRVDAFLESILHTSLNGIMCLKAVREKGKIIDFRVTFVNRAILKYLHLPSKNIIGKSVFDLNPMVREEGILQRYIDVTEKGQPDKFERKIGKKWFYVLLAKLEDGVTASFYNITDLKTAQQRLHSKVLELENTNLELEQFAYVTSHDLQEPLRKINMFADLLQKENSNPENAFHLGSIIRASNRMKILILKLLEYTRLKHTYKQFQNVDLNQIIRDLTLLYEDKLYEQKGRITTTDLPVIEAVPLQIYTLFDNLVNNALKFSKDGVPIHIDISWEEVRPDYVHDHPYLNSSLQYIKIVVRDNGKGFPQDYAEQIFKIFQKLESSVVDDDVGIGLAMCHKIVKLHSGHIYATSSPSEGSGFNLLLPRFQP
jgi:signal transduction histidine kinase